MDRRLTPANGRVAAAHLKGQIDAEAFVDPEPRQVTVPVTEILATPTGPRDRQLVRGETVAAYEDRDGRTFVQADRDGYCGYVLTAHLGPLAEATHFVAVRATHIYPAPDMKTHELRTLSFGSRLAVTDEEKSFFALTDGTFVPKPHLRPVDQPFGDPVALAELQLGTPYLWGGNSSFGLDCSGLIQMACLACGMDCPGDSDQQENAVGIHLPDGAKLQRGDLLFWDGHVGLMSDAETLLHANAHHMAVAYEPVEAAIARIKAQGDGPVTARKRL